MSNWTEPRTWRTLVVLCYVLPALVAISVWGLSLLVGSYVGREAGFMIYIVAGGGIALVASYPWGVLFQGRFDTQLDLTEFSAQTVQYHAAVLGGMWINGLLLSALIHVMLRVLRRRHQRRQSEREQLEEADSAAL